MKTQKFIKSISVETQKRLIQLIPSTPHRNTLYSVGAKEIPEEKIQIFENLVISPEFRKYVQTHSQISLKRWEITLENIFKKIAVKTPLEKILKIIDLMTSKKYFEVEKLFFHPPVDIAAYKIFEKNFISLAEKNINLSHIYLEYCKSEIFHAFREYINSKKYGDEVYEKLFTKITELILQTRSHTKAIKATNLLIKPEISTAFEIFLKTDTIENSINKIFHLLNNHVDSELLLKNLRIFFQRYAFVFSRPSSHYYEFLCHRLEQIWYYLEKLDKKSSDSFAKFLQYYGNREEQFQNYIWNTVFEHDLKTIHKAVAIFTSDAFLSLKSFYYSDTTILDFIIKNIYKILNDVKISQSKLPDNTLLLKLLLITKVNRNFLKERIEFIHWLKTKSSSNRIENEVLRFLFYEYLLKVAKKVKSSKYEYMPEYLNDVHKLFVTTINNKSKKTIFRNTETVDKFFIPVLEEIRKKIWEPFFKKFSENSYIISNLKQIAEALDKEDSVINALELMEPSDLLNYFLKIYKTIHNASDEEDLFDYDNWYRLPLGKALPYITDIIKPIIPQISIQAGKIGAYTDGETIYLPNYISFFKDPLDPINTNRNLTMYIGLALHEAGHILGCTFSCDYQYVTLQLENPKLFNIIFNFVEDYRIEEFIKKIKPHPQTSEILTQINRFLNEKIFNPSHSLGMFLIIHLTSSANQTNNIVCTKKEYQEKLHKLLSSNMPTGSFTNMNELIEHFINRLKTLEIENPFSSFLVAMELYEILNLWPLHELEDLIWESSITPKGMHENKTEDVKKIIIFTNLEQIKSYYLQCKQDPKGFFKRIGLPFHPQMFSNYSTSITEKPAFHNDKSIEVFQQENIQFEELTDTIYPSRKYSNNENESVQFKQKKCYIHSFNTKAGSSIIEIQEITVNEISIPYFNKFKKWEHLEKKVYHYLTQLLLPLEEQVTSSSEGEIDMELLVELLSNKNNSDRIEFLNTFEETHQHFEAVIGLDISGSTANTIANNYTILDVEKAFAIILGRALSYLSPHIYAFAFNSTETTTVYYCDPIDAISSLEAGYGNRDGDFLRYIKKFLQQKKEKLKYFFYISDGCPDSNNYKGKKALEDTLLAMREVVNSGIRLIYFNIDSEPGKYLNLFKREATYARHFKNPEQLIYAIPEIVHHFTVAIK